MFATLAVALVLAVPVGFKEAPQFEPAASFVAGKPIHVYCAPSAAAITATAIAGVDDVQGVTPTIGGSILYLSPLTCGFLNAWLHGKKPANMYGVAGSLQTLAHEAEHTKGVADETDADCASLKAMVPMTTRFFPVKKRITMHNLMALAWDYHFAKDKDVFATHSC